MPAKQTEANAQVSQTDKGQLDHQSRDRNLFSTFMSPFTVIQRIFSDDVARLLTDNGGQSGRMSVRPRAEGGNAFAWAPKIDVMQQGNELTVRADLPGVRPDDVTVEIGDDAIAISGERRQERAEETDGAYRYETTYGTFWREIPLPEGALVDQAKATFKDGVLEVRVPAPPAQVSRGRRIEISRGEQATTGVENRAR